MNTEVTNLMPAERPVEETAKPALTIVPKENENEPKKKTRAPKARPIEELVDAPTKGMTEKEAILLIDHLREQLVMADNKIEQYKQSTNSAFERARKIENDFNAMENYYKERLAYLTNSAKIFCQSVCLATKGDVK